MAALTAGKPAPDFTLPTLDRDSFSLTDALRRGPVLLAFFKVSCPVCQYAFPLLERLYEAHQDEPVTIVGVSQNDAAQTSAFAGQYGIGFPIVLDEGGRYPVSNAYGLTNVPTLFLIAPDGEIELSSVGWSRADFERIHTRLAEAAQSPSARLFQPGEEVPEFKPG
jgi:peroxiredoxin